MEPVEMPSAQAEAGDQSGSISLAAQVRRREMVLLLILASVQFTSIVDFMVVMPLGPQLQRKLEINNAQFGWIVASYTVAAGLAGLLASSIMDRFSRKSAFLTLYAGFLLGTLFCGLSTGYYRSCWPGCSRVHSEEFWGAWRWQSSPTFFRKNGAAERPGF